jgi:CubicO group peptidase (beta-lactamase class C family)
MGSWERKTPSEVGLDSGKIEESVAFAEDNEDLSIPKENYPKYLELRNRPKTYDDGIVTGPTKPRGGVNGLIIRHGYIVAEWGDTLRSDMTHSVTKSYLSTCAGLAFDRGLIRDVDDPVNLYVHDGNFDSPHNSKITWRHLLQQTNEWDGTIFGRHFSSDNPDDVIREPLEPGTFFEYNDARVNVVALALLHVWRRPIPQVLKKYIMDPIGASSTWRWHGYNNSWVDIDGLRMQSVAGGGHWGGGLFISSRDHARFGQLFLRKGRWIDKQLISESWIEEATTPSDINPVYGYMWWLNSDADRHKAEYVADNYSEAYARQWKRRPGPGAPASSYCGSGGGGHRVWIDPENDMVVVTRWMKNPDDFIGMVVDAVKE